MYGVDILWGECRSRPKETWMEEINEILRARELKDYDWEVGQTEGRKYMYNKVSKEGYNDNRKA